MLTRTMTANTQETATTRNTKRSVSKPSEFSKENFTPGSRIKNCDSWDRGYNGYDSSKKSKKTCLVLKYDIYYEKDSKKSKKTESPEYVDSDESESEYAGSDESDDSYDSESDAESEYAGSDVSDHYYDSGKYTTQTQKKFKPSKKTETYHDESESECIGFLGRCTACRQLRTIEAGGKCALCNAGAAETYSYRCQRCHRLQRIPHPMWRYQRTPAEETTDTWACHQGCRTFTRWKITPDDARRIPPNDRPPTWNSNFNGRHPTFSVQGDIVRESEYVDSDQSESEYVDSDESDDSYESESDGKVNTTTQTQKKFKNRQFQY